MNRMNSTRVTTVLLCLSICGNFFLWSRISLPADKGNKGTSVNCLTHLIPKFLKWTLSSLNLV